MASACDAASIVIQKRLTCSRRKQTLYFLCVLLFGTARSNSDLLRCPSLVLAVLLFLSVFMVLFCGFCRSVLSVPFTERRAKQGGQPGFPWGGASPLLA